MTKMGGLWAGLPRLGAAGLLFALAAMGLPGLGNFIAEFLVLVGAFEPAPVLTMIAALGFIAATLYALSFVQRVFHGQPAETGPAADLGTREIAVFVLLAAAIIWLGIYPQPVLNAVAAPLEAIMGHARLETAASSRSAEAPQSPRIFLRNAATGQSMAEGKSKEFFMIFPKSAASSRSAALLLVASPRLRSLPLPAGDAP
jgi:formate hydrogenlyase subunit 3/multisubunit Na+/H+ antiporter MnhD subunit